MLEREIFAAEEIALADFAFFGDEQVAGGAFFDADEVEAGVDVAGHFAVEKIEDDFAGRRGLPVPRADGSGGHRDDDREAFFCGVEGFAFGHPFRTLVVADHFFELGVGFFVGRRGAIDGDGGDGAGVDELLDAGALGGGEDVFCAADVGIVDVFRIFGPEAIVGGDVEDAGDAFERAIERSECRAGRR